MKIRQRIIEYSKGNELSLLWKIYRLREGCESRILRNIITFFISRSAHKHGGYIGNGAIIKGIPYLPHGLHGIYISRYATIGSNCWIYQNVTIGEVKRKAPRIGDNCLIGTGAVIVGNIKIGNNVKIGAGAVVFENIPDNCTVVSQPPRVLLEGGEIYERNNI